MKKISFVALLALALCSCKKGAPEASVVGGVECFCPDEHHPHSIDFGLPSGTVWSCCNLDADVPSARGGYYAWAEQITKDEYTKQNYILADTVNGGFASLHHPDIAMSEYDVVHMTWGRGWRLPTYEQFQELIKECQWDECTQNGVRGVAVSKGDKAIFIPAAGSTDGKDIVNEGENGLYWTGVEVDQHPGKAHSFHFEFDGDGSIASNDKETDGYLGLSIRPVEIP